MWWIVIGMFFTALNFGVALWQRDAGEAIAWLVAFCFALSTMGYEINEMKQNQSDQPPAA